MKILALEPYYGGSHRAFLDGWSSESKHVWSIINLRPFKWKWRMRHGAVTLADEVNKRIAGGESWDVLFCSDMLNLAEFRGLVAPSAVNIPAVAYFHENQLTYPVRSDHERDYHFAFTNFTTCLAADQVWFNSSFHRDEFLDALTHLLRRMPDQQKLDKVGAIRSKARVLPQGISEINRDSGRLRGPARILWAARWEHDKNPELFFEAIRHLVEAELDFTVSVIGEQFIDIPAVFAEAKEMLGKRILHWGYQATRADYEKALTESDIIVSTAEHEFFGVSVVEAIAAGVYPLLPRRLAYPEILSPERVVNPEDFFYDGTLDELVSKLKSLILAVESDELWGDDPERCIRAVSPFSWTNLIPTLDRAIEEITG